MPKEATATIKINNNHTTISPTKPNHIRNKYQEELCLRQFNEYITMANMIFKTDLTSSSLETVPVRPTIEAIMTHIRSTARTQSSLQQQPKLTANVVFANKKYYDLQDRVQTRIAIYFLQNRE